MRVLFVTHNVPRVANDAAGSFILRLAVALQGAGARVEIIAPGAPGLGAIGTIEGVPIHRIRYANDAAMTLAYTGTMVEQVRRSWRARFALLGMLRTLRRAVRAQVANAAQAGDPFDVVHAHWWFPAGLALWSLLPKGLPTRGGPTNGAPARVLTMHGSDVRLAQQIFPARALMRSVLDDFVICTAVSTWLATNAQRIAKGRAIRVAPMPVDTRHFWIPVDAGIAGVARRDVLFVGRLNAQKGISDLLAAMAHPALHSAALDIVGDGPDRDALQAQADALGVASRLRWHGALPQPDLLPLYQRAAVVAMPSREEGLGLVAVEAQLCGAPVVAYDSGGLPDVVQVDAGGTLVPAGDIDALANALAIPAHDARESSRRGRLAHERMRHRFSPEAVAAQYLGIYHAALDADDGRQRMPA